MGISVPNLAALQLVQVANLQEGKQAWVTDQEYTGAALFTLHRYLDYPPDGVNIIEPEDGSPIAGCPKAKWVRFKPGGFERQRFLQSIAYELPIAVSTTQTTQQLLMSQGFNTDGDTAIMAWISLSVKLDGPRDGKVLFQVLFDDQLIQAGIAIGGAVTLPIFGSGACNFRRGPLDRGFHVVNVTWAVDDINNTASIDPTTFEGHGSIMLAEVAP